MSALRTNKRVLTVVSAVVALLASFVLSGVLVYGSSSAAFEATTSNPANNWTTGSVAVTDDDGGTDQFTGTALFNVQNMVPSDTESRCITVTTTATNPTLLRFYSAGVTATQALDTKLLMVVERGTGGGFGSCTGFVSAGKIFDGTLSGLGAATTWAQGFGSYAIPAGTRSVTYRITYTLPSSVSNEQQSAAASATFVWTAQTT